MGNEKQDPSVEEETPLEEVAIGDRTLEISFSQAGYSVLLYSNIINIWDQAGVDPRDTKVSWNDWRISK